MTITFCLIPSIPLGVLREHSGFNHSPYSILNYENKLSGHTPLGGAKPATPGPHRGPILYEELQLPVDHQL